MRQSDLRSELEKIYMQHGRLTPELVRETARPDGHPLHCAVFDKPPDQAAEAYYLERAHELITAVRVVYKADDKPQESIRFFHAVRQENGIVYHPADTVVQDPFLARLVLTDMRREWEALKRRYESFEEFWLLVRKDTSAA